MARPINRLSARGVAAEKTPGYHADGAGLYLVVEKGAKPDEVGSKRWTFIFQWRGKRTEMGLGGLSDVSLAQARDARDAARKHVVAGRNPIAERKRVRAEGVLFGEFADELRISLEGQWKNPKHRYQWKVSIERHAAHLRPLALDAIDTEDVLTALKPIWQTIPETASRTRNRIEFVLDAAKAAGHRTGENPARWRGHLATLLPKPKKLTRGRHPAMPWAEVAEFMVLLRQRAALAASALELTILTVARTGETLGAAWSEFDRATKLWVVPPGRMKGGIEHRVPLAPAAIAVLDKLASGEEWPKTGFVFPGERSSDRPLSNMAMTMVMRRMKFGHYAVHGFRSTFRDWAGDNTNFAREVAEAALAHQIGEQVERAYRRGDALLKRRKMMETWATFIGRPPAKDNIRSMVRPGT